MATTLLAVACTLSAAFAASLNVRQGVTALIAPPGDNPEGTSPTFDEDFSFAIIGSPSEGAEPLAGVTMEAQTACPYPGQIHMRLQDGVITDTLGRRAYIASNHQLQFDDPPQAGAIWTAGFFEHEGIIGIGQNYTMFMCASGKFMNIYDIMIADYCNPVFVMTLTPRPDELCNGGKQDEEEDKDEDDKDEDDENEDGDEDSNGEAADAKKVGRGQRAQHVRLWDV